MQLRITRLASWVGLLGLVGGVAATAGCNDSKGQPAPVASGGSNSTQVGAGGAQASGTTSAAGGNAASSTATTQTTTNGGSGNTAGGATSAVGGVTSAGGNSATSAGGTVARGGSSASGGSSQGGSSLVTGGSSTGTSASGGSSSSSSTTGGNASSGSSTGGNASSGSSSGGANPTGGSAAITYALPAPNPCTNKFSIQDCRKGVASSVCGGVCTSDYGGGAQNVCEGGKSGVPVNFACPRFLLYSDEFIQAAIDDGYGGVFNYAIVGHDVDTGGADGSNTGACCQCYQIVFDYPNENQCWVDPNASSNPKSALPPPKAMIVQSFNTAAGGPRNFDIYMGAGGLGANNGCFSINGSSSPAGVYQYLAYPSAGQPGDGGVKPVGNWGNGTSCKNNTSWVTEATLGSPDCVAKVSAACNQIKATDARQQAAAIRSCIQSNDPKADYHLNWYIWVKRVECPAHLTDVTGCKLASQGLDKPDPNVTTVAQAKTASGFRQKDGQGQQYTNTTMEDCCMPTCAWSNNVSSPTVGGYNSFYSCDQAGIPRTQ